MGRRVQLRWMDGGEWTVVAVADAGWVGVEPRDEVAETLASFTPHGVVWFHKRDLVEILTEQKEALI